jgi:hypothetical protein
MRRDAETMLATALSAHGVKREALGSASTHGEAQRVLVEILAAGQQAPNPEEVLQTIEQMIAQVVRPK